MDEIATLQPSTASATATEQAMTLKDEGNCLFKQGRYADAIGRFTLAIDLDSTNSTFFCNRAMCYSSLSDWVSCVKDSRQAVSISKDYTKAYFHCVRGLLELNKLKDARFYLSTGLKECGEVKELKALETQLFSQTGIPLRPKPTDFEVDEELGDGNFSKIVKVHYKPNGKIFAMKVSVCLQNLHFCLYL